MNQLNIHTHTNKKAKIMLHRTINFNKSDDSELLLYFYFKFLVTHLFMSPDFRMCSRFQDTLCSESCKNEFVWYGNVSMFSMNITQNSSLENKRGLITQYTKNALQTPTGNSWVNPLM